MKRFSQNAEERARIIEQSLKMFGCTREALAAGYLRGAAQSDRSAVKAVRNGGMYRDYPVEFYLEHAKFARVMAAECVEAPSSSALTAS